MAEIQVIPVSSLPAIQPGDRLGCLIARSAVSLLPGDVVVIAQKVVSKAENRLVRLDSISPSSYAVEVGRFMGRDARLAEIILRETKRIVKMDRGILITETRHGLVCANAGVDLSNVDGGTTASLLPLDPDASAFRISAELAELVGWMPPVIITDTFGRPWREGLVEVAIGLFGVKALRDYRGREDPQGLKLAATVIADVDQLASAAGLVFRKDSGIPACLIRGYEPAGEAGSARDLIRPPERDLFR